MEIALIQIEKDNPEKGVWAKLTGGSINGTDVILFQEKGLHTKSDIKKAAFIAKRSWDCLRIYSRMVDGSTKEKIYLEALRFINV